MVLPPKQAMEAVVNTLNAQAMAAGIQRAHFAAQFLSHMLQVAEIPETFDRDERRECFSLLVEDAVEVTDLLIARLAQPPRPAPRVEGQS